MKQKLRTCNICNMEYEMGFFGCGAKYCGRACAKEARRQNHIKRYVRKERDCVICGRDITTVGLKSHASKYCSNRCMFIAQHVRAGQKTVLLKIPIALIPRLFKDV